jgi:hypothetical protein
MKSISFLVLLLVLPASAFAAEPSDLGQGLAYLRVHQLGEAIKPLAGSNALVLDLRHTTATAETVSAFSAALSFRAEGSSLFALVGPDTPDRLVGVLNAKLVTIGIRAAHPAPQVVVEQTAEVDRAAYAAYDTGTALDRLISGKIEKERFDEATLVHEFKSGNHDAKPPEATPAPGPGKEAPAAPAAPLVDRVLQRAVHLHHALLALKRG